MSKDDAKGKKIKTRIYTKDYKITGEVVSFDNYKGRLSDIMNFDQRFVNITGVEMKLYDDKIFFKGNYLCLNKDAIIFFYPEE